MKIILKIIVVGLLTLLTQVGGVLFLLNEVAFRKKKVKRFYSIGSFLLLYSAFTFLIIPSVAPVFGRVKINNSVGITPVNYMTVILNRNYVTPELMTVLENVENGLQNSNITLSYLDANFPFIKHFPLLPHLSHNDGNKIDLSLIYENKEGEISKDQKSVSGYGVFENPDYYEFNQTEQCIEKGYFQYDYPKYLTFGTKNDDLIFSLKGTRKMILGVLKQKELKKIFIEPHLKARLNINDSRIRYQGCRAVRHDDHIHIQL